jgi:two-component system, cell cycle sensor histidine kinase and response regulator CckA
MIRISETILIVDDDWLMIMVAQTVLESMGYQVLTASGGKEAIELYKQNKESIHLVILDIVMPELDGRQVVEQLVLLDPTIKILLCSAILEEKAIADLVAARKCSGFIAKPWRLSDIEKSVRLTLGT